MKTSTHQWEETQSPPTRRMKDRLCFSYFSNTMTKETYRGKHLEGAYSSEGPWPPWCGAEQQAGRPCAGSSENSHPGPKKVAEKEKDSEHHRLLKPHSPRPVTHFLILPKQFLNLGIKYSNIWNYGFHSFLTKFFFIDSLGIKYCTPQSYSFPSPSIFALHPCSIPPQKEN